jgi:hypothetical protein
LIRFLCCSDPSANRTCFLFLSKRRIRWQQLPADVRRAENQRNCEEILDSAAFGSHLAADDPIILDPTATVMPKSKPKRREDDEMSADDPTVIHATALQIACPAPHCERVATGQGSGVSDGLWTRVEILCPDGHRYSTQISTNTPPGSQPDARFGVKVA